MKVLVVGAGFAGLVVARRLAEQGMQITVIDKRPHVGGNAYDEVTPEGVRLHRYGPHLFHTSNVDVVDWLSRFTEWTPYDHRVSALLEDGRLLPLPINRRTLEAISGRQLDAASAEAYLNEVSEDIPDPQNARDYLYSKIGRELTEIFFAPYTRKMWGHDLSEMAASVIKRIPIRYDDEDRYFPNDTFQALPTHGYTQLALNILDHPGIVTKIDTAFDKSMLAEYDAAFLSMPIDEYYEEALGPLPYRSIRFHHAKTARGQVGMQNATLNFTDDGARTRQTAWHLLPGHDIRRAADVIVTSEEPCDYLDNNLERYYPVNTADGRYKERYDAYAKLAEKESKITFIGRCGTYQYLDMHQVINQTHTIVDKWLARERS